MEDIDAGSTTPTVELRDAKGRLMPGHARIPGSGRPPGKKNWSVRALAEQLGVNPFQISLEILKTQHLPSTERGKKGREVTAAEYIKVLTEVQTYLAPRLAASQITGKDEGPISVAAVDVVELMQDPALAAIAQELALGIAESERTKLGLPAPDRRQLGDGIATKRP